MWYIIECLTFNTTGGNFFYSEIWKLIKSSFWIIRYIFSNIEIGLELRYHESSPFISENHQEAQGLCYRWLMTEQSRWATVHGGHKESDDWTTEQTHTHTHAHAHTHNWQSRIRAFCPGLSPPPHQAKHESVSHTCVDKPPKATQRERETLPSFAQRRDGFFTALNNVDTNKSVGLDILKWERIPSVFFFFFLNNDPCRRWLESTSSGRETGLEMVNVWTDFMR